MREETHSVSSAGRPWNIPTGKVVMSLKVKSLVGS